MITTIQTKYDWELVIIDNSGHAEEYFTLLNDGRIKYFNFKDCPLSVPQSWNFGCEYSFGMGSENVIIVNNDIEFHKDCIDNLYEKSISNPDVLWSAVDVPDVNAIEPTEEMDVHPSFSCYCLSRKIFNITNGFHFESAFFKRAYFEDNSYHWRLQKLGIMAHNYKMCLFKHLGSRTVNSDPALQKRNSDTFVYNSILYQKIWGGGTGSETFDTPFNLGLTVNKNYE